MIGQSRSFAQANTGPRAVESDICTYLEWDSAFFDGRIARANCVRLDQSKVSELLDWCGNHRIDCLYFLADSDDAETARIAQQNDFREVDVRLTLDRPITYGSSLLRSGAGLSSSIGTRIRPRGIAATSAHSSPRLALLL